MKNWQYNENDIGLLFNEEVYIEQVVDEAFIELDLERKILENAELFYNTDGTINEQALSDYLLNELKQNRFGKMVGGAAKLVGKGVQKAKNVLKKGVGAVKQGVQKGVQAVKDAPANMAAAAAKAEAGLGKVKDIAKQGYQTGKAIEGDGTQQQAGEAPADANAEQQPAEGEGEQAQTQPKKPNLNEVVSKLKSNPNLKKMFNGEQMPAPKDLNKAQTIFKQVSTLSNEGRDWMIYNLLTGLTTAKTAQGVKQTTKQLGIKPTGV